MSIEAYFRMQFELLPPGEPLVLSRDRWDWILSTHGNGPAGASPTAAKLGTPSRPAVYGVAALAQEFGVAESSMRALLRCGLAGRPDQLQPHGPGTAYRVPAHIVARVRESIIDGHALGTCSLVHLTPPWPDHSASETSTHPDPTQEPAANVEPNPVQEKSTTAARDAVPPAPRTPEHHVQKTPAPPAIRHPTTSHSAKDAATDLGGWRQVVAKGGSARPT